MPDYAALLADWLATLAPGSREDLLGPVMERFPEEGHVPGGPA
jgi:hypothetical protein